MTSLKYLEVFVTDGLWCSLKKDHISDFWAILMCKMWSVDGFRKSAITFLTLILIMYLLLIMYDKDMTSLSECTIIRGWLLFSGKWTILQQYHWQNNVHFDEIMMPFTLYWTNMLRWRFIVLAHWNNSQ